MELGKSMIEIRKKNDMTQEEMAERYHVARQTIYDWNAYNNGEKEKACVYKNSDR